MWACRHAGPLTRPRQTGSGNRPMEGSGARSGLMADTAPAAVSSSSSTARVVGHPSAVQFRQPSGRVAPGLSDSAAAPQVVWTLALSVSVVVGLRCEIPGHHTCCPGGAAGPAVYFWVLASEIGSRDSVSHYSVGRVRQVNNCRLGAGPAELCVCAPRTVSVD
jgi:hypothetical protein